MQTLCLGLDLMVIAKEQFQLGVRFGIEIDHTYMYSHVRYEIL